MEMLTIVMMRMVLLIVFIGWLFMWVMLPTKTYKNSWTPTLTSHLKSTYFLEQGTNLLLFSFPMMFIAVLGCVFLHLQNKIKHKPSPQSGKKIGDRALWRRPVMVAATTGVVNALELTFAAMFVALLIWSLANYLYVSFGKLHMDKHAVKVWQLKFRSVSLRLGYIGNISWAFLFFPVTRGSSILPLVGLTSESSIKYHIWLGHVSMVLFAAHSVGFIIYWAMTNQMVLMLQWSRSWVSNIAGEIAFVFALVMWATSFSRVRRKMFELFFYTHQLYPLYLFFYIIHVGVGFFCTILPGVFLFLIDRHLRFLQSRENTRLIAARVLPCGTIELNFSKAAGLEYNPSSNLFVNVPSISKLQWHPFTVTSNSNTELDTLSVVIKCHGSWSQKLHRVLSSPIDHLQVSVEGPYGPSSPHFLRHENLVMISGGSGITPFIPIIRELVFQSTRNPDHEIPKVLLICAFKNSADLTMLDLLLPISGSPNLDKSRINLEIQAYITRETEHALTDAEKLIQTVWFKPNPSDQPISAVLGPNSWLWLGAIISSSFVMFLILLGLVTRYHIYPIQQKGDGIYNFTLKTLWDMFLVCACVLIGTSIVFMWQKKERAKEQGKVQSLEVDTTPTASPGAWFCGRDTELGSLPHQSLIQTTKVHFGGRPDLKKILSGYKEGSDVGVLACGPKKMRHDVAKICSSTWAVNLQFESMSFDW